MTEDRGMDCDDLVELVTDYLENVMPANERARFDEHLKICDGCEVYLTQMRQTIQLTGKLSRADVPNASKLLEVFRGWKKRG